MTCPEAIVIVHILTGYLYNYVALVMKKLIKNMTIYPQWSVGRNVREGVTWLLSSFSTVLDGQMEWILYLTGEKK